MARMFRITHGPPVSHRLAHRLYITGLIMHAFDDFPIASSDNLVTFSALLHSFVWMFPCAFHIQ